MFRLLSLALLNAFLSILCFDVEIASTNSPGPKTKAIHSTMRRHHYEPLLSFEGGYAHLRSESAELAQNRVALAKESLS